MDHEVAQGMGSLMCISSVHGHAICAQHAALEHCDDPLQAGCKIRFVVWVVNLIHRRHAGISAIAGQAGQAAGGCLSEPEELSTSQGRARAGPTGSPCSLSSAPISARLWSHKTCTCSCHLRSSNSQRTIDPNLSLFFFFNQEERERKKKKILTLFWQSSI